MCSAPQATEVCMRSPTEEVYSAEAERDCGLLFSMMRMGELQARRSGKNQTDLIIFSGQLPRLSLASHFPAPMSLLTQAQQGGLMRLLNTKWSLCLPRRRTTR